VQYPEKSAHPSTVGSRKQRKWPAEKANGKSERIRRGRKVRNRIKSRAGKRQGEEAAEVKSPRGVRRIVSGSRRLGTSGGYRQYIFAVQRAGYSICFESPPPNPPTGPRAISVLSSEPSASWKHSRMRKRTIKSPSPPPSRCPTLPKDDSSICYKDRLPPCLPDIALLYLFPSLRFLLARDTNYH
jgi:hypothetical protein